MSKKQIYNLVIDYQLWIAMLEQYLSDNHITTQELYKKLNQTKKQLGQLAHLSTVELYRQIQQIDHSLTIIQQQLTIKPQLQITS